MMRRELHWALVHQPDAVTAAVSNDRQKTKFVNTLKEGCDYFLLLMSSVDC